MSMPKEKIGMRKGAPKQLRPWPVMTKKYMDDPRAAHELNIGPRLRHSSLRECDLWRGEVMLHDIS